MRQREHINDSRNRWVRRRLLRRARGQNRRQSGASGNQRRMARRAGRLRASAEVPPLTYTVGCDPLTQTREHNALNQTVSVDGQTHVYDSAGNLMDDGLSIDFYPLQDLLYPTMALTDNRLCEPAGSGGAGIADSMGRTRTTPDHFRRSVIRWICGSTRNMGWVAHATHGGSDPNGPQGGQMLCSQGYGM